MESRKLLLWVVLVWLMLLGRWSDGCLEQEKAALLHLKPFFYHIDDLDNWVEEKQFGNCCEWKRVECNPTTGRVMHLFLNQSTTVTFADYVFIENPDYVYTEDFSGFSTRRGDWYLNASLFLPFQELKSLYLSGNSIGGCLHSQGFERLSMELDRLEILDLSSNYLNDSILLSLSELSSLKSLYLGENQFTKSNVTMNGIKKLSELGNLETLDLHDNRLLGNSILSQLDGFTSLKTLNLQSCGLKGTVHMLQFSKLMNLKDLYLANNEIESLQSFQGKGKGELKLIKLEVLGLSYNGFNDSIFSSLNALPNLKSLYIRYNQLTGLIDVKGMLPISLKTLFLNGFSFNDTMTQKLGLINLEVLDLRGNLFNHNILPFLGRLSNLKTLYFEGNLNGSTDIRELGALNNLEELDISCYFHSFKAYTLPLQSLGMLPTSLKTLHLNGFSFNGTMTQKLGLINLEVLDLRGNLFNFSILPFLSRLSNLKTFYFEDNLNGSLDIRELGALNNLEELDISCYFHSFKAYTLPLQSLGMLPTSLKTLHLNGFSFNGTMTQKLGLINLEVLDLRGNLFNFSILPFLSRLSNLKTFYFEDNLNGSPDIRELGALNNLEELDISCYFDSEYVSDSKACSLPLQSLSMLPTSLKTLSIGGFSFNGAMTRKWQNLTSLEEFGLYSSSLPSNLLQVIGTMTSLKYWEMNGCEVNGNLSVQGFCELTHLQLRQLDISNNNLTGVLPKCFSNLTSLQSLYLSYNQFFGDISALESLISLESLDLSYNQFSGDISALNNLTSLASLRLSSNQFSGDISTLNNLTSLVSLDLSSNQFSRDISALQSLISLRELSLSNNYFHIPSSLGPLFGLSKLKVLYANNNTVYAETNMPSVSPRFQLNSIILSCCGDGGSFPQFLYHQNDLRYVDLSNIYFKGQFPNWLLENNTMLHTLFLANNSLFGNLQLPSLPHTGLLHFDISMNYFSGNIPIEIGAKLPSLRHLNMSRNRFRGSIPASIGDMESLYQLDLSNNNLTSALPEHLAVGCSSLNVLILSNNRLEGQLFPSNFNLIYLEVLQLDRNDFTGRIPDCFSNCSGLSTLDLSKNQLYGGIPRWMGNMSSLEEIVMANNNLEGPIPVEFCQLHLKLKLLDLSVNNISGSIPSCFSPLWISQVHLSRNKLQGPLTDALRNSTILVTLDLSKNHLTGNIPSWIGNLSQLSYLLLNNNHFGGKIPVQLCKLTHLSLIDLSHNNLSGTIPPCLKITTLNDVSQDYVRYVAAVAQARSSSSFSTDESTSPPIAPPAPAPVASTVTPFSKDESVQFSAKNLSYSYKGRVLTYLSGIDLSCNKLTGQIPRDLDNFEKIIVLNLSHNSLTGPIPPTLSNLRQIESLDLSYNNLSGVIPPQLVGLTYLSFFSVAYNNLSGMTPVRTAQFSTFGEGSYLGNPFLCGAPLLKKCSTDEPPLSMPKDSPEDDSIDMNVFYVSFGVSYTVVLLAIASVLYINPYWRRAWFYHVETATTSCYYFVIDHLPKRCRC